MLGAQGKAFSPSRSNIGEGERGEEASLGLSATMSHQIHLQKTGAGLIPLLKCAQRNPLLEPRSCARGGETPQASFSLGPQEAVCGGSTQRQQLAAAGLTHMQMVMLFQGFDQGRQEWYEPLGANTIGLMPEQEQHMLNLGPICSLAPALLRTGSLWGMVEESHRRAACISRSRHHLVKQRSFV